MKKSCFILALIICLSLFMGCDISVKEPDDGALGVDIENSSFHFDSYGEMIQAFGKSSTIADGKSLSELGDSLGKNYSLFAERVCADGSFPQPMQNGETISYRNREGFSNILLSTSELYGLPWIWYYPSVATGENFYIKLTYLPRDVAGAEDADTASKVISILAPSAPNVNNKGSGHTSIYEKTIVLADRQVTALVINYVDDTRSSIFFIYDDLLVLVRCPGDVWDEAWFSTLSFE